MLQSCIYKCNPDLALSWPDILGTAGLTVIELIHGVQSNNVESFAGIIVDAAAKIKVSWVLEDRRDLDRIRKRSVTSC